MEYQKEILIVLVCPFSTLYKTKMFSCLFASPCIQHNCAWNQKNKKQALLINTSAPSSKGSSVSYFASVCLNFHRHNSKEKHRILYLFSFPTSTMSILLCINSQENQLVVFLTKVLMKRNCEKIRNSTLIDHADVVKYRDMIIGVCNGLQWE